MVELVDDATPVALTPSYPAFVALDRFTSPAGDIMGRHAVRWVAPDDLAGLEGCVARLRAGGPAALAGAVEQLDRGGNGARDVEAGLRALERGVAAARKAGWGLLLVGVRA